MSTRWPRPLIVAIGVIGIAAGAADWREWFAWVLIALGAFLLLIGFAP